MFNTYNKVTLITKSDTVDLPDGPPDAVYCGGAGNLIAVMPTGDVLTIPVVAGALLPIRPKRINSTSTTATGMFALYQV